MICPNCKSENVAQILRGLPDMTKISMEDIDDGKIILAVSSARIIPIGIKEMVEKYQ